jgi:Cu/Ag efflux protein CusF
MAIINRIKILTQITAIGTLTLLLSCAKSDQSQNANDSASVGMRSGEAAGPAIKQGQGRGLVGAVDLAGKTILLEHNDIPGIMDAMSMSYPVERPDLLQGLKIGDSVIFTLKEPQVGEYVVSAISVIPKK